MSQKAVTSLSFSVKKKEPIRVVQKNSLEQTTKKSASTSKKLQEKESANSDSQVRHSDQSSKDVDEEAKKLETDAIEEILKDTKRGATRAEISGSWLPPKKVNSRLVNNTLVQALQSNRRKQMKPKKLKK